MREAAYALGATKWQTTRDHVLPYSMGGILTGVIIALVASDRRNRSAHNDRRIDIHCLPAGLADKGRVSVYIVRLAHVAVSL